MPESPAPSIHAMAPLIRFTLLALYLALVLPLPLMAPRGAATPDVGGGALGVGAGGGDHQ